MKYDFDLENRREETRKLVKKICITVLEVAVVVFLAFAITHFGLETYTVTGPYMSPTLEDGDDILVNKMSYKIHSVKRNDVVVVKQSGTEHNYFSLERVIGLPGEKVQIKDGFVYIDGVRLKEKYPFPAMENGGLALEKIVLDDDEYFMLCDNRNNGEDSRNATVGNIKRENIIGKAWIRMNSAHLISHIDNFTKKKEKSTKDSSSSAKE